MNWRATAGTPKDIGPPKKYPVDRKLSRVAVAGNIEEAASNFLPCRRPPRATHCRRRGGFARPVSCGRTQSIGCGADVASTGDPGRRPEAAGIAEVYALTGFILLDDRHDATAAFQYLVPALQKGATPETTAKINRSLAAIEAEQKLHVGRARQ